MNIVASWMYTAPKGDKVLHPQVGKNVDTQKVQNYYWRCVFCLFESSARQNSNTRHLLFVNESPPEYIDQFSTQKMIDRYGIEIVHMKEITRPPKDYYFSWNTQFIVLDVLRLLLPLVRPENNVIILDSDCIFNQPISLAFNWALERNKALLYTIDYPAQRQIHGLSPNELKELSLEYGLPQAIDNFRYAGGEMICFKGSELSPIYKLAMDAYQKSLDRFQRGLKKFNEEAQLLTYVYILRGYVNYSGNPFIKRIWTNRAVYCNVTKKDKDLMIWHLPSEKKRGFIKYFKLMNGTENLHLSPSQVASLNKTFSLAPGFFEVLALKMVYYLRLVYKELVQLTKRPTPINPS